MDYIISSSRASSRLSGAERADRIIETLSTFYFLFSSLLFFLHFIYIPPPGLIRVNYFGVNERASADVISIVLPADRPLRVQLWLTLVGISIYLSRCCCDRAIRDQ